MHLPHKTKRFFTVSVVTLIKISEKKYNHRFRRIREKLLAERLFKIWCYKQILKRQSLVLLLMPGDLLLFRMIGIKKTSIWKTRFVSEYFDTVQSQSSSVLH